MFWPTSQRLDHRRVVGLRLRLVPVAGQVARASRSPPSGSRARSPRAGGRRASARTWPARRRGPRPGAGARSSAPRGRPPSSGRGSPRSNSGLAAAGLGEDEARPARRTRGGSACPSASRTRGLVAVEVGDRGLEQVLDAWRSRGRRPARSAGASSRARPAPTRLRTSSRVVVPVVARAVAELVDDHRASGPWPGTAGAKLVATSGSASARCRPASSPASLSCVVDQLLGPVAIPVVVAEEAQARSAGRPAPGRRGSSTSRAAGPAPKFWPTRKWPPSQSIPRWRLGLIPPLPQLRIVVADEDLLPLVALQAGDDQAGDARAGHAGRSDVGRRRACSPSRRRGCWHALPVVAGQGPDLGLDRHAASLAAFRPSRAYWVFELSPVPVLRRRCTPTSRASSTRSPGLMLGPLQPGDVAGDPHLVPLRVGGGEDHRLQRDGVALPELLAAVNWLEEGQRLGDLRASRAARRRSAGRGSPGWSSRPMAQVDLGPRAVVPLLRREVADPFPDRPLDLLAGHGPAGGGDRRARPRGPTSPAARREDARRES